MIIYFYGLDEYRVERAAADFFREKISIGLEGGKFDLTADSRNAAEEMKNFLMAASLFGSGRLALVKHSSLNAKKSELADILKNLKIQETKEIILAIADNGEDKKILKLAGQSFQFNLFENFSQAKDWILAEAKKMGAAISLPAAARLFSSCGKDSRLLAKELEKLAVFSLGREISEEDVIEILPAGNEANIFSIFEAFFNRDRKKSLFVFRSAIAAGLDPAMIFNLFIDQIRTAAYLVSNQEKMLAGVNPWKIKKVREKMKNFSKEKILNIFSVLADVDWAIKNGKTDFEAGLEYILMSF